MGAMAELYLDGFKAINDTLGHPVGDQVLRDVAQTLTDNCRRQDLAGRYGGDEFVLLISDVPDAETGLRVAEKLRDQILTLSWSGRSVSASVGVALFPDHGADAATLHRRADAALYASKQAGKNRVTLADIEADLSSTGGRTDEAGN